MVVVTRLIPRAMREQFSAAEARFDAVRRAALVFAQSEPRAERTRSALYLARWKQHIESSEWEAMELWFAGGFTAEDAARAFDDSVRAGVALNGPALAK